MNVWASMFCMGNPNNKRPQDILPMFFDDEDDDDDEEINYTPEEVAQMHAEMESAKELFKMTGTE